MAEAPSTDLTPTSEASSESDPKVQSTNKLIRADLRVYFKFNDSGQLICKLCSTPKEWNFDQTRGWYNFERHLINVHKISKDTFDKQSRKSNELHQYFPPALKRKRGNASFYKQNDPKQIQFENDCLDLVTVDGLPLDVTSKLGFKKMIENLNNSLRCPSRRTLGRRLNSRLRTVTKEIQTRINGVEFLHVSVDLWSSISRQSVIGIKAHFIESNWKAQTWTVGFKHFSHRKSAHNLRLFMKTFFSNVLKVKPNQIITIMADNAAENIKAFDLNEFKNDDLLRYDDEEEDTLDDLNLTEDEDLDEGEDEDISIETDLLEVETGDTDVFENEVNDAESWSNSANFKRLGCVAHALQLIVKDALKSSHTSTKLVKIINEMVSFFHYSNVWTEKLYRKTKKRVIGLGKTRWNTVCLALERMLEPDFIYHVNQIYLEAKSKNISTPELISSSTIEELNSFYQILAAVKELTDALQGDGITSSMVLLGIICLNNALIKLEISIKEIDEIRTNMCVLLVERFACATQESYKGRGPRKQLLKVFEKNHYVLAALLDPKIKCRPFEVVVDPKFGLDKYTPTKENVVNMLEDEVKCLTGDEPLVIEEQSVEQQTESVSTEVISQNETKKTRKSIFDPSLIPSRGVTNINTRNKNASEEISEYMNEAITEQSALIYWRQNERRFPKLSKLALKYLSLPASSGGVERLFSVAGSIARARRNRLSILTLEKILLYKEWRQRTSKLY